MMNELVCKFSVLCERLFLDIIEISEGGQR